MLWKLTKFPTPLKRWRWLVVGAEEVNWLFDPFLSRLCLTVEAKEAD